MTVKITNFLRNLVILFASSRGIGPPNGRISEHWLGLWGNFPPPLLFRGPWLLTMPVLGHQPISARKRHIPFHPSPPGKKLPFAGDVASQASSRGGW